MTGRRLRVPIGKDADRWRTVTGAHPVLVVVHNVTAATRLLDLVPLVESDTRVQVLFTWIPHSAFANGVEELLADLGVMVVPWAQAVRTPFALAIAASYGGHLHKLRRTGTPLMVVPHGMGYNKYLARKSKIENRKSVFGLSDEWLVRRGRLIPSTIVLSHPEQLARLTLACPQAAPAAVLAGDPCYDRLLASRPRRAAYRAAFGVGPEQRLVVVSSTWGPRSQFGQDPGLLSRLVAQLPQDSHRAVAVLHPNIWHGHGPWQVRSWLAQCERAGLLVLEPREGWRAALVAADLVIGDHGSVPYYAAAIGRPVLTSTFSFTDLDPASAVARFGRRAPRLEPRAPLLAQVDRAIAEHCPTRHAETADLVSAHPGEAAQRHRTLLYHQIALPEPTDAAVSEPVPVPELTSGADRSAPRLVSVDLADEVITVQRFPAQLALRTGCAPAARRRTGTTPWRSPT